jgi:hypothetical protein
VCTVDLVAGDDLADLLDYFTRLCTLPLDPVKQSAGNISCVCDRSFGIAEEPESPPPNCQQITATVTFNRHIPVLYCR